MTSTPCVEAVLTVLTLQVQPRASQEHRCAPHRTAIPPARRGAVDGFKVMTLHMPVCYDVEDKAEKPLTLRRIGGQLVRSE